jgi:conjugal transfer/type IV secretion protein DotA/TraY
MQIRTGQVLKYTLLPGLLPRLYRLFATGFHSIPYFIAVIYQTVGLLPRNHPYTDPRNLGRFGLRRVIAEAANNLVFDRRHIDQVIVFFVLMAGVVLLIAQMILLVLAVFAFQPAFAISFTNLMGVTSIYNEGPLQDMAFMVLDQVFGVQTIFGSCVSTAVADCLDLNGNPITIYDAGGYPTGYHRALHGLLRFYSLGIFNIAVFVVIYYVITITAETAETGSPFGRRLNRAWAPVRLILAFALLMPLNTGGSNIGGGTGTNAGFNGAQIITFWAAKLGSNFASNAWGYFNDALVAGFLYDVTTLVAKPQPPRINDLVKFIYIAKVCQIIEGIKYGHLPDGVQAYLVRERQHTGAGPGPNFEPLITTAYTAARTFSNYGPIRVRFGAQDAVKYESELGTVKSFCGDVRIPINDMDAAAALGESGPSMLQGVYYDVVRNIWNDPALTTYASCLVARSGNYRGVTLDPSCPDETDTAAMDMFVTTYQAQIDAGVAAAVIQQIANSDWTISTQMLERGWGGAAIWYNRLAELNGDIAAGVNGLPVPAQYPYIMEYVAEIRSTNNQHASTKNLFDPMVQSGVEIRWPRGAEDQVIAMTLNQAYTVWKSSDALADTYVKGQDNAVMNAINALFGTSGLYSMRQNATIHPLAQLTTLGKGMMFACLNNLTVGLEMSASGSALANTSDTFLPTKIVGALMSVAGNALLSISMMTMSMAFVLAYVLPFMPFIYYFFALGSWVKAIFEAIVAMPLWALAHIRIDGEGLGGPGATQGYFLILEIFLRPILILFGLIASLQIFAALVTVMNQIFDLVVMNAGGFDQQGEQSGAVATAINFYRGPIDRFFFTLLYVIMCFMLGTGCFKLIDTIPNTMLRWLGVSVSPFTAQAGDTGGAMLEKSYQISSLVTQKPTAMSGQLGTLFGGGGGAAPR